MIVSKKNKQKISVFVVAEFSKKPKNKNQDNGKIPTFARLFQFM